MQCWPHACSGSGAKRASAAALPAPAKGLFADAELAEDFIEQVFFESFA
jgi:hypothetical protein